jgi:hypothetical protein
MACAFLRRHRLQMGVARIGPALHDGTVEEPVVAGRTHSLGTGAADDRHHGLIGASDAATFMLDEDGLCQRLARWAKPEDADLLISAFRADRPEASPSDLFFAIATAGSFRKGAWTQADLRARQNAGPVYLYELDWQTPVDGGKWHSPHSLDLALVFDKKSASMFGSRGVPPSE